MYIIVDTNRLSDVFQKSTKDHLEFESILTGIQKGNLTLVYGGTKYKEELSNVGHILKIINLYKDKSQVVTLPDEVVDIKQKEIETKVADPDFDDPHLPAIAIVSRCHIICTNDKRFMSDVNKYSNKIFPSGFRLWFYTSSANADLLNPDFMKKNTICEHYLLKPY